MFALFSGLLGTAFSVLVRRFAFLVLGAVSPRYSSIIVTVSDLAGGESPPVNLACSLEATPKRNQVLKGLRTVVLMAKVVLLEPYPKSTS